MAWSETFRQMLEQIHNRVREARSLGLTEGEIAGIASQVGDWLARDAEPRTYEQRLLKEMWQVCDEDEKRVLARALVRVAEGVTPSDLGGSPPERGR